jgi:hypothetical protein
MIRCHYSGRDPAQFSAYKLRVVPCHVKTNRRDALTLARLHRAGELTPIWVPDPGHEAIRLGLPVVPKTSEALVIVRPETVVRWQGRAVGRRSEFTSIPQDDLASVENTDRKREIAFSCDPLMSFDATLDAVARVVRISVTSRNKMTNFIRPYGG